MILRRVTRPQREAIASKGWPCCVVGPTAGLPRGPARRNPQRTDFTLDVIGRYIRDSLEEALRTTDKTLDPPPLTRRQRASRSRPVCTKNLSPLWGRANRVS